uniref:Uncharacterized protein n=1 Tax=Candidatus Kentrum sp. SD TaxID=2126332 RepID=A0A450YWJ0_9GAMM|nr:MAG: hypothetical protein BECKSD772F_GA0070984_10609 [Candidatus Kentron sp. SD]VFK45902.1 MAG: hypothetical protein BECKSD772E_GA0070983_10638 [Candidatus Kentron sp. SD]
MKTIMDSKDFDMAEMLIWRALNRGLGSEKRVPDCDPVSIKLRWNYPIDSQ